VIKFLFAAQRKREDTQKRDFHEWGINTGALLLSTPAVMDHFRRYAQRHCVSGISNATLNPLSETECDSLTDQRGSNDMDLVNGGRILFGCDTLFMDLSR